MKITKTKSYQQIGEYKHTSTDKQKASAEILLQQCNPKILASRIDIKGRGIKPLSSIKWYSPLNSEKYRLYECTDTAWAKLQTQYKWMTDF